jgi:ceramide glucosyltransferase
LTAKLLERDIRFALGSTMATTKEAIASIGGFETLVDYLADDYELGKRITKEGYQAVIAKPVVETFLPDYDSQHFLDHQLRWGRTVRSSRPGGYLGMVTTFGTFWALLAVMFGYRNPMPFAWLMLFGVLGGKALVTFAIGWRVIGDRKAFARLWLLPLRELVTPFVWLISLFGNRIVWRGEAFELRDGKLYSQSR